MKIAIRTLHSSHPRFVLVSWLGLLWTGEEWTDTPGEALVFASTSDADAERRRVMEKMLGSPRRYFQATACFEVSDGNLSADKVHAFLHRHLAFGTTGVDFPDWLRTFIDWQTFHEVESDWTALLNRACQRATKLGFRFEACDENLRVEDGLWVPSDPERRAINPIEALLMGEPVGPLASFEGEAGDRLGWNFWEVRGFLDGLMGLTCFLDSQKYARAYDLGHLARTHNGLGGGKVVERFVVAVENG